MTIETVLSRSTLLFPTMIALLGYNVKHNTMSMQRPESSNDSRYCFGRWLALANKFADEETLKCILSRTIEHSVISDSIELVYCSLIILPQNVALYSKNLCLPEDVMM